MSGSGLPGVMTPARVGVMTINRVTVDDGRDVPRELDHHLANQYQRHLASCLRRITVCNSCLTASCWQGKFMCQDSQGAGTVDLPVEALQALNREHPDNWVDAS